MPQNYHCLINECRSCGSRNYFEFYEAEPVPVAGIYYYNESERLNIRAPLTLIYCQSCGLIQLKHTINPDIYIDYSFTGDSTASYQSYLKTVAGQLVNTWNIKNKPVYEVGASNGILLKYLSEMGNNRVEGVEPSQKLCDYAAGNGVNIKQGYFNKEFVAENDLGKFDCVIIRHVLEHIDDLNGMVNSLEKILAEDGILVIEVPDVEETFKNNLFSNIFHEHLNYFSFYSLSNLLIKYGFHVVYRCTVDIHGGSLFLVCKRGRENTCGPSLISGKLEEFAADAADYYSHLNQKLTQENNLNKVIHGYGASHRTFLLMGQAQLNYRNVPVLYDNNSFLHNKRLNGIHSLVLPVESISTPDAIVIFAISYEEEIKNHLKNFCRFKGEIISLKFESVCSDKII